MRLVLVLCTAAALSSCGYHVGTRQDGLPLQLQRIAIPAFANASTRYRLTDSLPGAITREFISRTRYHVVPNESEADAVLTGGVLNYEAIPNVIDQQTGRYTAVLVSVSLNLNLVDRKSGQVLWTRPNMVFRQRYEIATDPRAYFEESELALERLSRDVARSVVSAVVEAF